MLIKDERDSLASAEVSFDTREQSGAAARRRKSRWLRAITTALALLIPLLAITTLLLIFQPFADAAGGCGGG